MPKAYGFTEYGGPETQEFLDLPKPEAGPSELLVAVHAAGVNPVDWKIRAGQMSDVMPLDFPSVFGREVAGIVEVVGGDVDGFAVGDAVLGTSAPGSGGYAEYAVVTASTAAKKPVHLSFTDAAALPVAGTTAYDGVRQLDLHEGQTLLINGAGGGVGVIAAQLDRAAGVNVIGTASEAKRALLESLGATLVVYGDDTADRIRQLMPGGVDAILDLVGGNALRSVAPLLSNRSKLVSTADPQTASELGGAAVEHEPNGETLAAVAALVANGKVDPHVLDIAPLEKAGEALTSVESGHAMGNIVLQVR